MNIRKLVAIVAASAALAAAAALPSVASAEVPSGDVPAALKSAIKANVEARGKDYLGFCRDVPATGDNAGKWCIFVQSIDGNTATVTMGPWATNDITTVIFTNTNGTWAQAGAGPTTTPSTDTTPAALKAAIKASVEARGASYLGFCRDVAAGPDVFGKWCATIVELTSNSAVVNIAPYATDQVTKLRFAKSGETWALAADQTPGSPTTPATPKPPATGDGTADRPDDTGYEYGVIAIAAVAGMTAVGAAWTLRARAR